MGFLKKILYDLYSPKEKINIRSIKLLDFSVLKYTFSIKGKTKFLVLVGNYRKQYKQYGKSNLLETNHLITNDLALDVITNNRHNWVDLE